MASPEELRLTHSMHLVLAGAWAAGQLAQMHEALRTHMAGQGWELEQGKAGPAEKSSARALARRQFASLVSSPAEGAPAEAGEDCALEVSARMLVHLRPGGASAMRCRLQFLARRVGAGPRERGEGPFLLGRMLEGPLDVALLQQDRLQEALAGGVAVCFAGGPQVLEGLAGEFVRQLAEQLAP
jgi:hypothetical protein